MTKLVSQIDKHNSIESIFQEHWKTKYCFVYTSFISDTSNLSAIQYQMIPGFIQNPIQKDQKYLIILFHSSKDSMSIKNKIDEIIENCRPNSHMDVWIIETVISKQQLSELMFYLTAQLYQERITPPQCMICNYFCFQNPTSIQRLFEKNIPLILEKCLNSYCDGIYSESLYQWFGHSKYTVHLIYPYTTYKFNHLKNLDIIEKYCRQIPLHEHINVQNFSLLLLEIELANNRNITQSFKEFCLYCLDIHTNSLHKGLVAYQLDFQYKMRYKNIYKSST